MRAWRRRHGRRGRLARWRALVFPYTLVVAQAGVDDLAVDEGAMVAETGRS